MRQSLQHSHPLARVIRSTALGLLVTGSGLASSTLLAGETGIQQQVRQYSIPAGPLGTALTEFASQAGITLAIEPELVEGRSSPGLTADASVEEGLGRLLQGSGLRATSQGDMTYTLYPNSGTGLILDASHIESTTVENPVGPVSGYIAKRSTTATKTDTPLLETPQSISVITRDRMTAQGAQSVSESLAYTAGVYANVAGNNPTDNTIIVRGFQQINTNAYTDGLRNNEVGYYAPEPYGMERIEVLKGPASVLYGQGSPGGTVNFVSKRPTFSSRHEIGLSTGSNDRTQVSLDLGDVLDEQKTLSYRLVALGRDANSSIDDIKDDRIYIAPSLTWRPDEETSITLLTSYQRNKNLFTSNLPYSVLDGSNPNGKVPRHRSLNESGFDAEKAERTNAGYELSHDLNEHWTFRQNFRYSHYVGDQDALHRNSDVINNNTIARYYQMRDYASDNYTVDNQLLGTFETGPFQHTLLMGTDYQRGTRSTFTQTGNAPSINIYHPDRTVVIDTSQYTSRLSTSQKNRQSGIYLQDQIKLTNWVASLSGRYDWASLDTRNRLLDTLQSTDAEAFTGRAGLGYLFDMGLFPYVSYTESFTPTSGTSRTGSPFEPETAKQYEIGMKYQPIGRDSYITLAAFDLRRQNVLTTDPINTSYSVQQGEVTSRGVELETMLKPTEGLNVMTSYSINNVAVTKDNPNALGISNKGNTPVRTPRHLASLWADYTLQTGALAGLGAGIGVRYTGSSQGDVRNTFKVPDYTLVDAMVHYDFAQADRSLKGLSTAINVKNLTDRYYVAGCFLSTACLLGAGRTMTADLTYSW